MTLLVGLSAVLDPAALGYRGLLWADNLWLAGVAKPGLFNGMRVLLFIPAVGLQTMIFTSVIGWFGYDGAAAQQSARALEGLRLVSGGFPFVFLVLGTVPLLWFRLAKDEHTGGPSPGNGSPD